MRAILASASVAALLLSSAAVAAPSKDAKGQFIKCAPPAATRCKDAHGKFAKCSMAGAKPM